MCWRKQLKNERAPCVGLAWVILLLTTACAPASEAHIRSLTGWTYKYGGTEKWKVAPSLLNPPGRNGNKELLLRTRLPRDVGGKTLFIPYGFTNLRIIHRSTASEDGPGFVGKHWRMLDLKSEDAGSLLLLRFRSDYHFIGLTGDVLLGRRSTLVLRLLRLDLDRFALAVIYVFLGLVGLFLYVRTRSRRDYLAFTIFILSVALYTVFYTRGLQLFFFHPRLMGAAWLISLFVMPASMTWFMELIFGAGPGRVLQWLRRAIIAYGIVAFSAAGAGLVNPLNIRLPLFALLLASIIMGVVVLVGAIRRGDVNARIILVGFALLAGFVLLDVNLALFAEDSTSRPRPMSHLGMFAFALSIIYVLGRRFAQTYRDLARYSRELEQARDELAGQAETLEGKVRERTEALHAINRELEQSNATARADMEMAAHVQSRVLPLEPPQTAGWDIACHYEAALAVSGDFYDFFTGQGELRGAGLFDVSGHGTASGLITILTRSIVNRHFRALENRPLGETMQAVNDELIEELERVDNFVTGVLIRTTRPGVDCVLAGHTRPLIKRRHGGVETIGGGPDDPRGSILGTRYVRAGYSAMSRTMDPGDALVLYTDALLESEDENGTPFQMRRLRSTLGEQAPELTAREALEHIRSALAAHMKGGTLADDLTIIVLKKVPNAP